MEVFNKVINWAKSNIWLAVLILIGAVVLLFPKVLRGVFAPVRKRRRRVSVGNVPRRSGRSGVVRPGRSSTGRGYPAAKGGCIPFKYNKDGTVKKAWQVAGTMAAKQRMNKLRKRI